MRILPKGRIENIVVQQMDQEILIYDLVNHKAFSLNETAAAVYQACDGKTNFDTLNGKFDFSDDLIFFALDELKRENLIDDKSYVSPFVGLNRRQLVKTIGLSTLAALPVIASILAPTAVSAQSVAACGMVGALCNSPSSQSTCCTGVAFCSGGGTCTACRPAGETGTCASSLATCTPLAYTCCSNMITAVASGPCASASMGTQTQICSCL